MKIISNKWLQTFVAIIVLASLLACGGGSSSTNSATPDTSAPFVPGTKAVLPAETVKAIEETFANVSPSATTTAAIIAAAKELAQYDLAIANLSEAQMPKTKAEAIKIVEDPAYTKASSDFSKSLPNNQYDTLIFKNYFIVHDTKEKREKRKEMDRLASQYQP